MTDKEFLELLMLYQAGKVPLVDVGLALARNQFSHEYIALANNILTAQKEQEKASRPQRVVTAEKSLSLKLSTSEI